MQKLEMLNLLKDKVCQCNKCPDLVESRRQHVFGEGNPNADIVFLGEAPGQTEDETGRPFVGKSGELLNVMLENINIKREDVYILNIVKCRPERNRNPFPEEAANCRPFLDLQLKVIRPKIIVCLGAVAAKNLLNSPESVNKLRGSWYNHANSKVRVTFHPSYLLRNPSDKAKAWEDFEVIKQGLIEWTGSTTSVC
jgi:DNA polymerase